MGKRSNFKRMKGDFYVTPESAVLPLIPHLPYGVHFYEPCAGDGALIDHLEAMTDTFGNGERMSNHIAGLCLKEWPRRLSRPDPKTCRSWMRGDTEPKLSQIVYLLNVMRK